MRVGIYKTPNMTEWYINVLRDSIADTGAEAHVVGTPNEAYKCFYDDITMFCLFGHPLGQALNSPVGNIKERSRRIVLVQTEQLQRAEMFKTWVVESARHADAILETAPEQVAFTQSLVDIPVLEMPLGFHHTLCRAPQNAPVSPWDVFMIDSNTVDRKPFMDALKDSGINHANVSTFDVNAIALLARGAKICLTSHAYGENSHLATFRVIGLFVCNRGFVMSQRSDYPYLTENKHIVYYDTPEEMVDKCKYYIEHQDEARAIAEAAHEHIKRTLPMEAIMRGVIANIESTKQDRRA